MPSRSRGGRRPPRSPRPAGPTGRRRARRSRAGPPANAGEMSPSYCSHPGSDAAPWPSPSRTRSSLVKSAPCSSHRVLGHLQLLEQVLAAGRRPVAAEAEGHARLAQRLQVHRLAVEELVAERRPDHRRAAAREQREVVDASARARGCPTRFGPIRLRSLRFAKCSRLFVVDALGRGGRSRPSAASVRLNDSNSDGSPPLRSFRSGTWLVASGSRLSPVCSTLRITPS